MDTEKNIVAVRGKKGMYRKKGSSEAGERASSFGEIARVLSRPVPSISSAVTKKNGTDSAKGENLAR